MLSSYSIDNRGKEHIYIFATENWIIADNCDTKTPCEFSIDALEDSVVIISEKAKSIENANVNSLVRRLFTLQHWVNELKCD